MSQVPQISKKEFTADVNNGMKREQLMNKYNVSKGVVNEIAKVLGLKIKKSMKPKFTLIDDTATVETVTAESTL